MDKTWIVTFFDNDVNGYMVFIVRRVTNALMARKTIVEEFKRQGWGDIDLDKVDAYSVQFRGNENVRQMCKLYAPQETKEQSIPDGMPLVEYV